MSLNLNEINIDLFMEYFSDNLLNDNESDLIVEDTEVKGYNYKIRLFVDDVTSINIPIYYNSPVPLNVNGNDIIDGIVKYELDKVVQNRDVDISNGIYNTTFNYFKPIKYTMWNVLEPMSSKQQLFTKEFPLDSLYSIPTYSEYTIFIKNDINTSNTLNTIIPSNQDSYDTIVPYVKIKDVNEVQIHQDEIQLSSITNQNVINEVKYNISTIDTYYGTLNLSYYVYKLLVEQGILEITKPYGIDDGYKEFTYLLTENFVNVTAETSYNLWVIPDENVNPIHIGILNVNNKSQMPEFNEYGQPLFKDKGGNITSISSTGSNFKKHNTTLRQNYFSLIPDDNRAAMIFENNTIGAVSSGDDIKFIHTAEFTQSYTFKKTESSSVVGKDVIRAIINPKITEKLKTDPIYSYSKTVRFSEDVLKISDLPRLMYLQSPNQENGIMSEINNQNTFFILNDIKTYKIGDVVVLDNIDPTTMSKVVKETRLGKITGMGTLYTENDVITAQAVTEFDLNDDVPENITPEYYLIKTNNNEGFNFDDENKTATRITIYQNSLDLDDYYEITETWTMKESNNAIYDSTGPTDTLTWDVINSSFGGVDIRDYYEKFELLKYDHIVIKSNLINWQISKPTDENREDNPNQIFAYDLFYKNNISEKTDEQVKIISHKKKYGRDYYDIIRVGELAKRKDLDDNNNPIIKNIPGLFGIYYRIFQLKINETQDSDTSGDLNRVFEKEKLFTFSDFNHNIAHNIESYIEYFGSMFHHITDGYIESRGNLIPSGASKEYEANIFKTMLINKINTIAEHMFPIISDYDKDAISKYKIMCDGINNFIVKNNTPSTYNQPRVTSSYTLLNENLDMILRPYTITRELPELQTDNTIEALVEIYSKNVFQRIYEHESYQTNYEKKDILLEQINNDRLYSDFDDLELVANDSVVKYNKKPTNEDNFDEYSDILSNVVIKSLEFDYPGETLNDLNNTIKTANTIKSYKNGYGPVISKYIPSENYYIVEPRRFVSSKNIIDQTDNISQIVKDVFGYKDENTEFIELWDFNDVNKESMKIKEGE